MRRKSGSARISGIPRVSLALIRGFSSSREARDFIGDEIRFLPSSGLEVWLTSPPGILIQGLSGEEIHGLRSSRGGRHIEVLPDDSPLEGIERQELIYGGLF